jgi:predicted  nucleic acid-binding Zn-ribbon protein
LREDLSRLMSLQILDRRLKELEDSLATISAKVDQLREETATHQAELEKLSEEDKQALLVRKQMERELAEGEARIRNHRMRLNLIRNDKELQAISHEVETQKETNQRLEAEVLVYLEAAEQRAPRIKELTELVQSRRAELLAAEKEIAGQVEELKSALARQRAERDSMAAGIDDPLRQRYEMIFNRRGGTAVVAVKSGTCQGCRMRIPPQLYNEIQREAQIYFCPNCQRILYCESASEA